MDDDDWRWFGCFVSISGEAERENGAGRIQGYYGLSLTGVRDVGISMQQVTVHHPCTAPAGQIGDAQYRLFFCILFIFEGST